MGFVQLYPLFSSTARRPRRLWLLNDLYVAPEARQGGVGRALMRRARRLAEETGAAGSSSRRPAPTPSASGCTSPRATGGMTPFSATSWACRREPGRAPRALDDAIAAARRLEAGGWWIGARLRRLLEELAARRAEVAAGQRLDREWAGRTVRWVAGWLPDGELPLLARLGAIVRAAAH